MSKVMREVKSSLKVQKTLKDYEQEVLLYNIETGQTRKAIIHSSRVEIVKPNLMAV